MSIEQFRPAPSDDTTMDKDQWRDVAAELSPTKKFDSIWAGFLAMRDRVSNPRRRQGGDVARCAPVLFDPCQYFPDTETSE